MRSEKRGAAGNSVLAALVITALKVIVGFSTGSLGILSEAAHSGLDLIASLLTFFSVGVSDKPADADHQYGHGKIGNFSAFVETGLLFSAILRRIDASLESDGCQGLMYQHNRDVNLAGDRTSCLTPTRDAQIVGSLGRVCCKASHFLRN